MFSILAPAHLWEGSGVAVPASLLHALSSFTTKGNHGG
jgi:hypothetical protein